MSHEETTTKKEEKEAITVSEATAKIIKIMNALEPNDQGRVMSALGALFES